MGVLIMILQLILGLSVLVAVHEFGHYIAARAFGMRVHKFFIFFDAWGKKLWSKKIGETEFGIGIIPFGGYVQIAGMIDETQNADALSKEPEPWEFRAKPAWQRLIVMLGGIIMNVITGILIFSLISYTQGENYIPNERVQGIIVGDIGESVGLRTGDKVIAVNGKAVERFNDLFSSDVLLGSDVVFTVVRAGDTLQIHLPNDLADKVIDNKDGFILPIPYLTNYEIVEIAPNSPAEKAGLQKGDKIVGVNQDSVRHFYELSELLAKHKNEEVTLKVLRRGQLIELTATVGKDGKLGFQPAFFNQLYERKDLSLGEAFVKGTSTAFNVIFDNIKGFKKIFRGEVSASKSLAGPIGIGAIYGSVWDWLHFWTITGLLSMVLAFMNLLPIPALDGGHVVFLLLEILSGRPVPEKILEKAQQVGMVILLALMVFAVFNDLFKFFT
ncbi:RIP metalloprotease RseP [Thermonema rossianum]|uniref:RIP metalloprotease RseP n=1 Tax=Thermonema rossianum TaxID=55505 RepID=UPI0005718C8E|nr:RIP metalloprotease RseP [Thermonema rossianum]